MHVVERHQDLGAVEATAFFVKRPHFLEPVEELAAFAKLEGKIFAQQRPARCTSTCASAQVQVQEIRWVLFARARTKPRQFFAGEAAYGVELRQKRRCALGALPASWR